MTSKTTNQSDLEGGFDFELERIAMVEGPAATRDEEHDLEPVMNDPPGDNDSNPPQRQHKDFDNSANPLWSLYTKGVRSRDEARIQTLKDDMDGILLFAGLFSSVLSAFVVPQIQDLKGNSTDQILSQIYQNIALIGPQISVNPSPPLSYATHIPSASDRRVNVCWLISLICSLSAALLATLVQQWVRAYMRIYQRPGNPLKTARIQMFMYKGVKHLPVVAEAVPGFIHFSLILFFVGLGDAVLAVDIIVGVFTLVPIVICGILYFCCTIAPMVYPQSLYRSPFSGVILRLIQVLHLPAHNHRSHGRVVKRTEIDAIQEHLAMEETRDRSDRDVSAIQWLVGNINGSNDMETFVLAFPGFFDQDLGQEIWQAVSIRQSQSEVEGAESTLPANTQVHYRLGLPSLVEGTPIYNLCRCVRSVLETYNNGDPKANETRRRRMRGCVETAACLVCCADVPSGWLGGVQEVLSEVGHDEQIKEPLTIRSNPSFAVRWTCFSLVTIRQMVMDEGNRVRELAGFAVSGIARFQLDFGALDAAALNGAERIDEYLKIAWEHVEDLHRAFEPWDKNKTIEEIGNILGGCESQISELQRIQIETDGMEDIDWRMSLLLDAMDKATNKLTRQLPGLSFHDLKPASPIPISAAFNFPFDGFIPVTPQLIFPGQQVKALCTLGRRLRDIVDGQNVEKHEEILESLESIDKIPVPLRRLNHLMKRQLWRLQDLRDGGGFGFGIELFFLAFRQLSSASLSPESKRRFYIGTFKVITSRWREYRHSFGTQRILLDLICDLVIKSRGVFSDFSYPAYIVDMLLELVGNMVDGLGNTEPHIHDIVEELLNVYSRNCLDRDLRDKALQVLGHRSSTTSYTIFYQE